MVASHPRIALWVAPGTDPPAPRDALPWARELDAALRDLHTDQQTFLHLSYVRGLTHDDIARLFQVSRSTVSAAIAAAMARLAARLAAPDDDQHGEPHEHLEHRGRPDDQSGQTA